MGSFDLQQCINSNILAQRVITANTAHILFSENVLVFSKYILWILQIYIYLFIHHSICGCLHLSIHAFFLPQKWNVSQTKIRVISTVIFILFGCLLFVTLPAIIFKHIEGWSALESIYFVVITLTTIGFGDFVAGEGERRQHEENSGEQKRDTHTCA